jgi:hypothetical protein
MFYFNQAQASEIVLAANARYRLGQIAIDPATGDIYRFVKNGGADTSVATKIACSKAGAGSGAGVGRGTVTMTVADVTSGTLGTITRGVGLWQAAVPTGYCGWLLVVSEYAHVFTDGGVVDGDYLVIDGGGTETFIADTAVAGEEHGVFGQALADDISTDVLARVNFLG